MLADGAEKLIFVNYIVASTTQIFVYSFGGSLLVDASQRIEIAAYNFHWYKCNAKVRSLILMIMIRAQKKTGIDVPFFEASLETFMSVSWLDLLRKMLRDSFWANFSDDLFRLREVQVLI